MARTLSVLKTAEADSFLVAELSYRQQTGITLLYFITFRRQLDAFTGMLLNEIGFLYS